MALDVRLRSSSASASASEWCSSFTCDDFTCDLRIISIMADDDDDGRRSASRFEPLSGLLEVPTV